jgi:hypothetical protein
MQQTSSPIVPAPPPPQLPQLQQVQQTLSPIAPSPISKVSSTSSTLATTDSAPTAAAPATSATAPTTNTSTVIPPKPIPKPPAPHPQYDFVLPDAIAEALAAAKARRAALQTEHYSVAASARRALFELDMSGLDLRLAEQRRKIADEQLEKAKTGVLGVDYVRI